MANHVVLTGRAIEVAVRQSDEGGETLHVLLEVCTGSNMLHVKVVTDNPQSVNQFRRYDSRPLYICGELREDSDGSLYVHAALLNHARPRNPHAGFKKINPLPLEKLATR